MLRRRGVFCSSNKDWAGPRPANETWRTRNHLAAECVHWVNGFLERNAADECQAFVVVQAERKRHAAKPDYVSSNEVPERIKSHVTFRTGGEAPGLISTGRSCWWAPFFGSGT